MALRYRLTLHLTRRLGVNLMGPSPTSSSLHSNERSSTLVVIAARSQSPSSRQLLTVRTAQVHFHSKEKLKVWDSRDGAFKERVPKFEISVPINIDLPVRFAAKVALAAGYYVYGDLFRQHVDHRQLRDVMNTDLRKLDLTKTPADLGLGHLTLRVDSYLRDVPYEPEYDGLNSIRALCSSVEGSVVVLAPGYDCFGVGVGILGQYVATVIAQAKTDTFPNDGNYAGGHVLAVNSKALKQCSLVDGLSQWAGITDRDLGGIEWGKDPPGSSA